jgi:predicted nucleic acid-binding protein
MDLTTGTIYIDANILIYALEGHDLYGAVLAKLMHAVEIGSLRALTSELTLAEVLVGPLRDGDSLTGQVYEQLLEPGQKISTVPIDRSVLGRSALIRSTSRARLPDAIHVATAELMGCKFFLTEDRGIPVQGPLKVINLADLDSALNSWTTQ